MVRLLDGTGDKIFDLKASSEEELTEWLAEIKQQQEGLKAKLNTYS